MTPLFELIVALEAVLLYNILEEDRRMEILKWQQF